MTLTPQQIQKIESSWDVILLNPTQAGTIFYAKLFELNPELRQLFKGDIELQSRKLISLITFVVHKLDNFHQIVSDIQALGLRHKKYNVKAEYYSLVGLALLWTLEKNLGNAWNEEIRDAWQAIYSILSKVMIKASEECEWAEIKTDTMARNEVRAEH